MHRKINKYKSHLAGNKKKNRKKKIKHGIIQKGRGDKKRKIEGEQ